MANRTDQFLKGWMSKINKIIENNTDESTIINQLKVTFKKLTKKDRLAILNYDDGKDELHPPLMIASGYKYFKVVKYLLIHDALPDLGEYHALLNTINVEEMKDVDDALWEEEQDPGNYLDGLINPIVEILLQKGADPNVIDHQQGEVPLIFSIIEGHEDMGFLKTFETIINSEKLRLDVRAGSLSPLDVINLQLKRCGDDDRCKNIYSQMSNILTRNIKYNPRFDTKQNKRKRKDEAESDREQSEYYNFFEFGVDDDFPEFNFDTKLLNKKTRRYESFQKCMTDEDIDEKECIKYFVETGLCGGIDKLDSKKYRQLLLMFHPDRGNKNYTLEELNKIAALINECKPKKGGRKTRRKTSRKRRKSSRKQRKTRRKSSRKRRKSSRKQRKTRRKSSRKRRKTRRKSSRRKQRKY